MDMSEEKVVLCVSNAYQKKFYINDIFADLPKSVREELQIISVLYTEDIGGVLTMYFDPDGNLEFETTYEPDDFFFDEIGSVLKIKQYRNERRELFEGLELYYRVKFMGENPDE